MRITFFLSSLLFLSACRSFEEKMISGKWNAAQLTECDDLVPINTAVVNLEFMDDEKYVFNSTLDIHEEGTYRIKHGYLYLKDITKANSPEKALFIRHITPDSMVLAMNYKGKDQLLTMVKEGYTNEALAHKEQAMIETTNEEKNTEGGEAVPVVSKEQYDAEMKSLDAVAVAKAFEPPPPTLIEKKPEKRPEPTVLTPAEAYKKREEKRKKEEAAIKTKEKLIREGYLLRERERKKEEEARKRAIANRKRQNEDNRKSKR